MIKSIYLRNFKIFADKEFQLAPLTLLTGANASGKSSIIQGLLLLRQGGRSLTSRTSDGKISLDGSLVRLGKSFQILNHETPAGESDVEISVRDNAIHQEVRLLIPDCTSAASTIEAAITPPNAREASVLGPEFIYLYANRLSPQADYRKVNEEAFRASVLGDRSGSDTLFRLQEAIENAELLATPGLAIDSHTDVATATGAWMAYIMGDRITPLVKSGGDDKLSLDFATPDGHEVSALNMAFGYTYILPVILAILISRPGGIVVIENPEAHLHPDAQYRLAELLARGAQNGIQVICETHSDHIVNGIRVAVKNEIIEPDKARFWFVEKGDKGQRFTSISFENKDGVLSRWPRGFMDCWERAIDTIFSLDKSPEAQADSDD